MNISAPVLSRIGNTPIVRVFRKGVPPGSERRNIYAKIESVNPGFSVKDRVARAMMLSAIEKDLVKPGKTVVVEPTSGNTGIGLALVCAALGIRIMLVMPETMSVERRKILKYFGAEIVLTEGAKGMAGAVERAGAIVAAGPDFFMPNQFENPENPEIHRRTTAMEFLDFMAASGASPDAMVFGVGTGGTLTGVSEVVKKRYPKVRIYAVEPDSSPVLSGGAPGAHKIQGIGAGFVPGVLNRSVIDGVIRVRNEEAFEYSRRLAAEEGILAGFSSGAAAFASLRAASGLPEGSNIYTLFPDSAERYLSMID